jgi:hypothetical protein
LIQLADNQAFHSLIIKPFENQTVTLPWLSRISDTSETQPKRLDSDSQINISTLICSLDLYHHRSPSNDDSTVEVLPLQRDVYQAFADNNAEKIRK